MAFIDFQEKIVFNFNFITIDFLCYCDFMVSPPSKVGGAGVPKRVFHGGTNFLGQIYGNVILGGKYWSDHVKGESFINAFSNNLNTISEKIVPNHGFSQSREINS